MSDIVKRLRNWDERLSHEAADEIERLGDRLNAMADDLRETLLEIERLRGVRSETRPHVVYRKGKMAPTGQPGMVFPNWDLGRSYWVLVHHTVNNPFVISTISREIEPETPIIDVNE